MGALPQRASVQLRFGAELTSIPAATEKQAGVMTAQQVADLTQLLRWQGSITGGGSTTISIARQVANEPAPAEPDAARIVDAVMTEIVQPALQTTGEDIAALLRRVETLEVAWTTPTPPPVAVPVSTPQNEVQRSPAAPVPPPLPSLPLPMAEASARTERLAELGALLAVAQIAISNNAGGYRWLRKDRDFEVDGVRMDADEYREFAAAEIAKLMEGGQ